MDIAQLRDALEKVGEVMYLAAAAANEADEAHTAVEYLASTGVLDDVSVKQDGE